MKNQNQNYDKNALSLYEEIVLNPDASMEDTFCATDNKDIKFSNATHKDLYRVATFNIPGFHHSQINYKKKQKKISKIGYCKIKAFKTTLR